jgi:hypothetical protein
LPHLHLIWPAGDNRIIKVDILNERGCVVIFSNVDVQIGIDYNFRLAGPLGLHWLNHFFFL